MIIEITQPLINQYLATPPGKRTELCDSTTKGLVASFNANANANSTGAATWYLRHKNAKGTTAYQRLGTTMTLTVQGARLQAMILKDQIAKGIFPADRAGASDAKPEAGEILLREYFRQYLERAKQTKISWVRDIQAFRHIDAGYGDQKLKDITLTMIQRQRTEQMNTGLYKAATVNHSTKLWRQLLRQSAVEGLRPPLLGIKLLPVQNMVENYLDDQQLGKLLSVLATHENRTVCRIALWLLATGARSGEALKAKWSDIDRERRLWKIPAANSKGKVAGSAYLNSSSLEILDQLQTQGRFDHLFINEKTGKPYTTITKSWERIRTLAGVPHFRIHDLRHQHAVLLINSGRTLFEVATALRHKDPNTTTIRYAHLTSQTMQVVSDCADFAIRRAMATATATTAAMAVAPAVAA